MSNAPIIKVENLAKSFGDFQAVKSVGFQVNKGDVFGFLGPNGAGKSTTIRCLLSLIKPDAGNIELFGKSYSQARNEILRNIGSIIEKPDFYKYLSAKKNLEIFARISGKDIPNKRIDEMLDFVGLSGRGKDKVGGFSHGMKQRLGIAQTLLHEPELIILDEPTTGLDPQGIVEIRNLILRLRDEQNKTVVLSSHQLYEIELIANRMVIINKGKTIVEGEVSQLLSSHELLVRFETAQVNEAANLVTQHFSAAKIEETKTDEFTILIPKNQVAEVNKLLVENHIAVEAIEPKRKLEDFFMKIINE
ncbi:MAG: hypothetical protein RL264_2178 [Bacteroidota bacterium]|jgi:ABC-2 type transport system ATP-binding protein